MTFSGYVSCILSLLIRLRTVGLALMGMLVWGHSPVKAQFPCPGGPGPGQGVTAMGPDVFGKLTVPICYNLPTPANPSQGRTSAPPVPQPPTYRYIAVAWHPDAADVWATWNRPSEKSATENALGACSKIMRNGCTIALSAWNSTVAIAQSDIGGNLNTGWGAKPDGAREKAMEACAAKSGTCKIKHQFTVNINSDVKSYYPGKSVSRQAIVMIAFPEGPVSEQRWAHKAWLVSGQGGYEYSRQMVLNQCKKDSGLTCTTPHMAVGHVETNSNGVIASYFHPVKGTFWFASASKQEAETKVRKYCAGEAVTCSNVQTYDAFTKRLQVLDSPVSAGFPQSI